MKKILFVLLVAALVFGGAVACSPKGAGVPSEDTDGTAEYEAAYAALEGYLAGFGHVRVLGDIDHVLKGTMDATMKLSGAVAWNETKTELTLPLSLSDYDFDGHKNPEDPDPEKYTRIADGTLTLVLKGAMNAEGSGFVATGYEMKDVDVTLSCDTSTYILLNLPETAVKADSITGIFTTKGGVARSAVTVAVTEGKAAGVEDVNTPKFGDPSGAFTLNGLDADFSLL